MRCLLVLLVALTGSACAFGTSHRYHDVIANVPYAGSREVAVATRDERAYVVIHDKSPAFVGLSRGGYGNPFDVATASGRPLADDMSEVLARSLDAKGFAAVALPVGVGEAEAAVVAKARESGVERVLVLTLYEWKSDTMTTTALHYDVVLRVFDPAGALLGQARLAGKDSLGGSALDPPGHAKKAVPPAFRLKLEELLAGAEVAAALR